MANELYTRTNQRLYFAALLLNDWKQLERQSDVPAARALALREAVLFHLHGALLSLCHEIAGYYRLPGAEATTLDAFLDDAWQAEAPTPEFTELAELDQRADGWLAQLREAYQATLRPPKPAPTPRTSDPQLIAVASEPERSQAGRVDLEQWRLELQSLALRFRESLSEC